MRVWRWKVYYKDFTDEQITDRALSGVLLSNADEDTVTGEIHEYLNGELGIDADFVYKFDIWEDTDKAEL
jgi:hypothetical protein